MKCCYCNEKVTHGIIVDMSELNYLPDSMLQNVLYPICDDCVEEFCSEYSESITDYFMSKYASYDWDSCKYELTHIPDSSPIIVEEADIDSYIQDNWQDICNIVLELISWEVNK